MFGRQKKSDGFEWHRYVPTVIRQRREARHQRVLDARRAAAQQMGGAGSALAAGSIAPGARQQRVLDARRAAAQQMGAAGSALAAGSIAAGAAARDGARAGLGAAGLAAQTIWGVLVDLLLV